MNFWWHWRIVFVFNRRELRWVIIRRNLLIRGKLIDSCSWSCVKLVVVRNFVGRWQLQYYLALGLEFNVMNMRLRLNGCEIMCQIDKCRIVLSCNVSRQ